MQLYRIQFSKLSFLYIYILSFTSPQYVGFSFLHLLMKYLRLRNVKGLSMRSYQKSRFIMDYLLGSGTELYALHA